MLGLNVGLRHTPEPQALFDGEKLTVVVILLSCCMASAIASQKELVGEMVMPTAKFV